VYFLFEFSSHQLQSVLCLIVVVCLYKCVCVCVFLVCVLVFFLCVFVYYFGGVVVVVVVGS